MIDPHGNKYLTLHCRELEYNYSPIIGNLEYRWTQIKAFESNVCTNNDLLFDYWFFRENVV